MGGGQIKSVQKCLIWLCVCRMQYEMQHEILSTYNFKYLLFKESNLLSMCKYRMLKYDDNVKCKYANMSYVMDSLL